MDNFDRVSNFLSRKNSSHNTIRMVFQNNSNDVRQNKYIKMKYSESNSRSIRDILQCQPKLPFFKSVSVKSQIIVSGTFVNGIYSDILSQTAIREGMTEGGGGRGVENESVRICMEE